MPRNKTVHLWNFYVLHSIALQVSIEFSDKWYLTHGYTHEETQSDYHMFLQYVKINFKEILKN